MLINATPLAIKKIRPSLFEKILFNEQAFIKITDLKLVVSD